MKAFRTLTYVILCYLLTALVASAQDVGNQVFSLYAKKGLFLRHPVETNSQQYDPAGTLLTPAKEGPWTLFCAVELTKVELTEGKMRLSGKRIVFVYDSKRKDLVAHIDKHAGKVDVELRLSAQVADLDQANAVIKRVFATSLDEIIPSLPDYWRDYFQRQQENRAAAEKLASAIHAYADKPDFGKNQRELMKIGINGVTPPQAVYTPAPEYTDVARRLGIEGDCVLSAAIDATGRVVQPHIRRPLGAGLDEQALAIVAKWQFKPATHNGQPVSTEMALDIAFQYP